MCCFCTNKILNARQKQAREPYKYTFDLSMLTGVIHYDNNSSFFGPERFVGVVLMNSKVNMDYSKECCLKSIAHFFIVVVLHFPIKISIFSKENTFTNISRSIQLIINIRGKTCRMS